MAELRAADARVSAGLTGPADLAARPRGLGLGAGLHVLLVEAIDVQRALPRARGGPRGLPCRSCARGRCSRSRLAGGGRRRGRPWPAFNRGRRGRTWSRGRPRDGDLQAGESTRWRRCERPCTDLPLNRRRARPRRQRRHGRLRAGAGRCRRARRGRLAAEGHLAGEEEGAEGSEHRVAGAEDERELRLPPPASSPLHAPLDPSPASPPSCHATTIATRPRDLQVSSGVDTDELAPGRRAAGPRLSPETSSDPPRAGLTLTASSRRWARRRPPASSGREARRPSRCRCTTPPRRRSR